MSIKDQEKAFLSTISANLEDEEIALATIQGMIAAEISIKRQNLGMSQKEFAEKMGVSQGLVSRWENGDANFTLSTLISIANKLKIPMQSPFVPTPAKIYTNTNDNIIYFQGCGIDSYQTFVQNDSYSYNVESDTELEEM